MKMAIAVVCYIAFLQVCFLPNLKANVLERSGEILTASEVVFQSGSPTPKQKKQSAYSIKLVPAEGSTYGYEIYSQKKLLIRQINIPGRSGMRGFKTKSDATKVANLVISKLSKGIMPPTIEKEELDKLHIQY